MREYSVPARFSVGEHENIATMVFEHERDDPSFVIYRRQVDGVWTDVTCAEAAQQIRAAALGLISLGVQAGDRVSIFSATRYEWAILDLAILSIGAVTVPVYETSSAEQVRWVLQDSEAVVAFAETDAHAATVTELTGELPALRRVLHIDGAGPKALDQLVEEGASVDPEQLTARLAALRSDDPATLIYTSGTTGRPKGCQLTHSNLLYETRGAKECLPTQLNKGQRLLIFLPLAHVLARALTLSAFANKVTVGITSDIKNLLPMFAVFKPTVVVSVPRVFEKVYNTAEQNAANDGKGAIFARAVQTAVDWSEAHDEGGPGLLLRAKHALFDRLVYHKLRAALGGDCHSSVSGGAPLGARLGHFYRGVGLTIHEGYGLTETTSAITVNQVGRSRSGPSERCCRATACASPTTGSCWCAAAWCSAATGATNRPPPRRSPTAGSRPAISARSTRTASSRSPDVRRRSSSPRAARTSPPAVLEDQLRAHPLISQAMVVGDAKPFVGALITIDPEAFAGWKERNSKAEGPSVGDLATDPDLVAEIDAAVKQANLSVSHAESIRKFRILPVDFTEDTGELTPTMKLKRNVVAEKFASDIEALYQKE